MRRLPPRPPLPGQPALFDVERVSRLLQAEYETGIRVACSPCAVAGRDELGLPNRIEGDPTPLCLECWRRRERQTGLRGSAGDDDDLVEWVEDLPAGCPACESPDPSPGCWLCGYSWLADARAAYELQMEAEQAAIDAEQARVDAEFARVVAREQAAQRVEWLTAWVDRVRGVLAAYVEPGRRDSPWRGWGRAVVLLADALARDAAARSSNRGRPSAFRLVAAVMAVDADYRSGRRAMPGRAGCAELAGVCERAVTSMWRHGVEIRAWIRTTPGRRLTLDERSELQRGNDRAVYDLRPVHRSADPAAREAMIPAALQALDELLGWAMQLLTEAQHALGLHDVVTQGTGRATSADVLVARTQRARLRQAVARTRAATTTLTSHLETGNKCSPHLVSIGECVNSCLGVGLKTFVDWCDIRARRRPRSGRGKNNTGASRSSTRSGSADLDSCGPVVGQPDGTHPAGRPRTAYTVNGGFQDERKKRRRKPPEWAHWAYSLALELRKLWTWLRYQPLTLIAATLGARLGERWTAAAVVDFIDQARNGRPLPVEQHTPVGLLRDLLEHALTGSLQPPYPARRRDEHDQQLARQRRAMLAAQAEAARAATAAARTEDAERDAMGAGARTGGLALAKAVLAKVAARRGAAPTEDEPEGWPQKAQPGGGLPDGWSRRRDR